MLPGQQEYKIRHFRNYRLGLPKAVKSEYLRRVEVPYAFLSVIKMQTKL